MADDPAKPTIAFLLSLPRAGSTLVQRVIGGHERVATVSEPWLPLPLLYTLREEGVCVEYRHRSVAVAVRDLCEALPGGRQDYLLEIRRMIRRLYERLSGDADLFLDKCPRYGLIVDELLEAFPDDRFIFLWRNPLAVIASMIRMHARNRWNLHRYEADLFTGLPAMIRAAADHADRVHAVRYEDLVTDASGAWLGVFDYLGLAFDPALFERLGALRLGGTLGDQTGVRQYDRLSTEPLTKWKTDLANPVRKLWCGRYLRWLGPERLAAMGYELDDLLAQLDATPTRWRRAASDLRRIVRHGWPHPGRPRLMERS